MDKPQKKLLIVEDEEIARDALKLILKKQFSFVETAANGHEALSMMNDYDADIVITDLAMPVMDGFSLIKRLKQEKPEISIVIITAYRDEAEQVQDYPVVFKPINRKNLMAAIEKVY